MSGKATSMRWLNDLRKLDTDACPFSPVLSSTSTQAQIMELSNELVNIIISYSPFKALATFSGINREVAALALKEAKRRLKNPKHQAASILLPTRYVRHMGVTAVCKIVAARDRLLHQLRSLTSVDEDTLKIVHLACFFCRNKGMLARKAGKVKKRPTLLFECSNGDNPCHASYRMYFTTCKHPNTCPEKALILLFARCTRK